jgi:quercetin dioxygenase-like cupin family protein
MTQAAGDGGFQVYDSNAMEWDELYIEQLGRGVPVKAFTSDPDTGMSCQLIKYVAGFINPWHTHSCAHGIYVISGTLRSHKGEFPAGSFVWFPEGMQMYHGATDEADCVLMFITNKPFDIHYTFEDEEAGSEAQRVGRERAQQCSMASVTASE